MTDRHSKKYGETFGPQSNQLDIADGDLRKDIEEQLKILNSEPRNRYPLRLKVGVVFATLLLKILKSALILSDALATSKRTGEAPSIDLTGGIVEFLLRIVMTHDDLDDHLGSLEEAYTRDVLHFGSKHPWWGIFAARFHLYWWTLITFAKKGVEVSPAGKLVHAVAKKWGF